MGVDNRPPCWVEELGLVLYARAQRRQRELAALRRSGEIPDCLLLLEHPPVITIGRAGTRADIIADEQALAQRGIEVCVSERGGEVTYHGPGQLVGYPIFDLREDGLDLRSYWQRLEEVIVQVADDFGLPGERRPNLTGVWCDEGKLAAIGLRVSGWVASHGFALNVNNDLSPFALIHPCGMRNGKVTSLSTALGRRIELSEVRSRVAPRFGEAFGRQMIVKQGIL